MPWKEKTMEENRAEFVKRVLAHEKTKSALCHEYGISRPTGDKWIKRYENGETLSDRSRAPFKTANRIDEETEKLIVERRKREPAIGAVKQRKMLEKEGFENLPSASTFNAVYKRNNLITAEASAAATPNVRFEKSYPNEMWQCDFKGHYDTKNGVEIHPLSVVDDYSRFCLSANAQLNEQLEPTKEEFIKIFKTYGMPFSLLCDNGNPWGACQSGAITGFEVFMMEHGILVFHIRPKRPKTQGKIERFNGSFKQERLKYHIPDSFEDAQMQRNAYRDFYNNIRPHAAINYQCPAERYTASTRKYADKITEWDYGSNCELRKIKDTGYLTFRGQGYFLSVGLGGKTVCLRPSSTTDGVYNVLFREFCIAKLNLHENTFTSKKIYLLDGDPRNSQD